MERVALDPLAAVEEAAEVAERAVDRDAERVLDRRAGAHLVRDRADPADPGGDVGRFGVVPAPKEPLEEAWWLVDVELHVDELAVATSTRIAPSPSTRARAPVLSARLPVARWVMASSLSVHPRVPARYETAPTMH